MGLEIDLTEARKFVEILTGSAKTPVIASWFDDNKARSDRMLAGVVYGPIDEHAARLAKANTNGCGVFVQVNAGIGRGKQYIEHPRACFADDDAVTAEYRLAKGEPPCPRCGKHHDGALPPLYDLPESMIIQSSANERNRHTYWKLAKAAQTKANLERWSETQQKIACALRTDSSMKNIDRVMRLPGFYNCKFDMEKGRDGTPFLVRIVEAHSERVYSLDEIAMSFPEPAADDEGDISIDFGQKTITGPDGKPLDVLPAPDNWPKDAVPSPEALKTAKRIADWLFRQQVAFDEKARKKDPLKFVLKRCCFNPSHIYKMAIRVYPSTGAIWAGCYHDSDGSNRDRWPEVKDKIGGWGVLGPGGFKIGSQTEIASQLLEDLAQGSTEPIVHTEGDLWRYSPLSGIWAKVEEDAVSRVVQGYDGRSIGDGGKRLGVDSGLIEGVRRLAAAQVKRQSFFTEAAPGLAFADGFVRADEEGVRVEPFSAEHHARAALPYPYDSEAERPRFEAFLEEIFLPDKDGEEKKALLQEQIGAALLGLATRFESALFLTGQGANGKALALNTPIPTSTGWSTQGKLRIGDNVFDEGGKLCKVIGLSPIWRDRPCYQLTFSDHTTVVADADHEWTLTRFSAGRPKNVTVTTKEIAEIGLNRRPLPRCEWRWGVPMARALATPAAKLLIHPYILGYWLANGSEGKPEVTCNGDDVGFLKERFIQAGCYIFSTRTEYGHNSLTMWLSTSPNRWSRDNLRAKLSAIGVLNKRYIPSIYLRASEQQRLDLLHGLMDGDGSSLKHQAQCEYCSTDKTLAEGVLELVRTFGLRPTMIKGKATLEGRVIGDKYRVIFTTIPGLDVFSSPRKLTVCRPRQFRLDRKIVACEPVPSVPTRCIEVDSPARLYLCSEAMIPTHNSVTLSIVRALFPASLRTAVRPQDFENEYYRAHLVNSRLNLVSETPAAEIVGAEAFKAIISGEQISGRRPAGKPFEFEPVAAHWFAANSLPPPRDSSHGFWRRATILAFNRRFEDAEADKYLADYIVENELPGIASWAIDGARRLLTRGHYISVPSSEAEKKTWRQESDVVLGFIEECCPSAVADELPTLDDETDVADLYENFQAWCRSAGVYRPPARHVFGRRLKQLGYASRKSHGTILYRLVVTRPPPTSAFH